MRPLVSRLLFCAAALLPSWPLAAADGAAAESDRAWRRRAADRPRRILFNNDGNDPVTAIKRPSVEDMLAVRTAPLAGTQVDAIFYCTFCAGFGNFTHLTKIGQVHTSKADRFEHNQMEAFAAAGIDPLRVMTDFAHQNRMELFWSFRMNDTHDGGASGQGPVLFAANRLKTAHPEYLLGGYREKLKHGSWSGVNYALPEIRELAFRYVEEVCRNYDVDGVELDFFRHPVFFKSTTRGEPATAEEIAGMTAMMRRIRTMADDVGRKRGRPILLAAHVPDSAAYCRAIGLDLERWLADDLFDVLVPAGYFQLNDWETSVALGHRYGVKVYPSLDETRLRDEAAVNLRMTDLGYRGRAANVWSSGADGIYLFNFFEPKSPRWRELGDPRGLARLDKDYFASFRGVGVAAGGNLPFPTYQMIETLNPTRPNTVAPGGAASARLRVGEDLKAAGDVRLTLRLQFGSATAQPVSIKLNGKSLPVQRTDQDWIECAPTPADVRRGFNDVEVALAPSATKPVKWLDVMLTVRHPASR
ncbi:MAG: family 10 glycosylhydrolase [Verrucomicrobia bacterium]|nr:family 10 glycosylhydrolase [Verrucomicrobiota bacterium]